MPTDDRDRAGHISSSTRHRRAGLFVDFGDIVRNLYHGVPWGGVGSGRPEYPLQWPTSGQRDCGQARRARIRSTGVLVSAPGTRSPKARRARSGPAITAARCFGTTRLLQTSQDHGQADGHSTRHNRCPAVIPNPACRRPQRCAGDCGQTGHGVATQHAARERGLAPTKAGAIRCLQIPMLRARHRWHRPTEQRYHQARTWRARGCV